MDTPSHLWKWEMGGGKESERTSEGKVRKKKKGKTVPRRWGRSEGKIEAQSTRWQEVWEKRGEVANKHRSIFLCFPFCVSSIIQCQNIYLPISDKDRIEGKFAVGVIFRHVLIAWIYLQLAFALLISREEWERNSIIQTWLCHKQSLKADNNTGCLLRLCRLDSKCELSL